MKVVILAGGLGTLLSEETIAKPKPMVEIGDMPIETFCTNMIGTRHSSCSGCFEMG